MSRRSWTERLGLGASHSLVDESAMDLGRQPRAPAPPPAVKVKRKKVIERPTVEQASLLSDESTETLAEQDAAVQVEEIEQRPNAVIRNGGPQLLRGLMLPLCPSSNRYWTQMIMPKKGTTYPLVLTSMRHMLSMLRSIQFPSSDAKSYAKSVSEYALQRGFRFNTEKPLRIDVVVCPRDRREIDPHNYEKALYDALQTAGVYVNDSQLVDTRCRLGPIIKGGRIVVSLWEITPNRDDILKEAWG